MKIAPAALALFVIASCGQEPLPSHMPPSSGRRAHATTVQSWPGSDTLRANKTTIVQTLRARGESDWHVALIVAAAMAETTELKCCQRDIGKDQQGGAKNFSCFNMNGFALSKLGWNEGSGPDINDDAQLSAATTFFSRGLKEIGEEKWLWLHRGGETAMNDGHSYGAQEYAATIKQIAQFLLADPSRLQDSNRYGCFLQHV